MNIVGIIIAKENSTRFPGKNYFVFDGRPMFMHAVDLLKDCEYIDDIFVATDSDLIKNHCAKVKISTINRGVNIAANEQPFFDVLKFAYQSLNKKYDIIVSVLANSINHTPSAIESGIKKMIADLQVQEIRSFDDTGNQSGIIIFREKIVTGTYNISNHMASIKSNGHEIHYRSEIDE